MKHTEAFELLQDFVDGELPAAHAEAVAAHAEQCPECRREIAALRRFIAQARELPDEERPARDLWPGIESRLTPAGQRSGAPSPERSLGAWLRRLLGIRGGLVPVLAATAAVVLIIVLARGPGGGSESIPASEAPAGADAPAVAVATDPITALPDRGALAIVQALDEECRQRDHELEFLASADPKAPGGTVLDVITTNLEVVNQAITEARDAWQANPSCPQLVRLLTAAYRAKAALQGEALELAARTG